MSEKLGLFNGEDKPSVEVVWSFYQRGLAFNNQINLDDTVRVNENFYVGKQWEGVNANGLPTPQFNIMKRVCNFTVATINSDNLKVNATPLENTPKTDALIEPARIVNEEFEALVEFNDIPSINREFTRNAAVDGDGCTFTYWDADVDVGGGVKGAIKTEILQNTRVFFGNPNDRQVQTQPYIQIASREIVRNAKIKAKENGVSGWEEIKADSDDSYVNDSVKLTDDKVTVLLTMWKDDDGVVWGYESTQNCEIRKPYKLGIRLYPITWLCWDYIQDCYHGQAMITGLVPNQIFINKAWAMSMLSMMRTAWPKIVYDKTRVSRWDNRVGGAIGINGGDVNSVARVIDPASISPQISQFIQLAVEQTEQSLGATSVALGDTRPDNTSAIIALQRAAATPSEMTKQNLYRAVEDLFRIYLEFMGEFYGKRTVDIEMPDNVGELYQFAGMQQPETMQVEFDFSILKDNPMMLKLDIGASSYYSEIAAVQTLDNLRMAGQIDVVQYLERIPESYIPRRRALINELKRQQAMMAGMPPEGAPAPTGEDGGTVIPGQKPDVQAGRGYGSLQHQINKAGSAEGLI